MNKKIFLYLAIFGSISVQAQERWSLRQCIDYAIEHNISIRQTANAAEQSAVEVNTAKWARLPNLNASAGQSWNWGRTQTAIKNEDTGDYSTVYVNYLYRSGNSPPVCIGQTKPQSCHCRPGQSQGRHCHQYSFGLPSGAVQ